MSTLTVKKRTSASEIAIHRLVAETLGFAPRIIATDGSTWMETERIPCMNVADKYGEHDVPQRVWKRIHEIVHALFHTLQMEYIDITGYNFIEDKTSRVWCIDYEHVTQRVSDKPRNWFLRDFLDTPNMREWNPDFA